MYASDSRHPDLTLQEKLEKLYTFRGGATADLTIRPDLYALLERLGNPHKSLPPVFHVAGTNGKGSVLAILQAILEAAGYSVHKYTSPHLQRFNERIVLNGRMIDDARLEDLLDEVTAAMEGLSLTFFEITTAMAFVAFSNHSADCVLLETGLGGRLDCTNVIETPLMTMITSIGLDHREFLGDTLDRIAREKAGIMKRGTPCVIAPQDDSVMKELQGHGDKVEYETHAFGDTWRIDEMGLKMRLQAGFQNERHDMTVPCPALSGRHQVINAGVAITALLLQDEFQISEDNIAAGLKHVHWPARMQRLPSKPLGLDEHWTVYLDGGHNEKAGRVIAEQIKGWKKERPERPVHLLIGMLKTKDPEDFVTPLCPYIDSVTALPIKDEPSAFDPESLSEKIREIEKLSCSVLQAMDLNAALRALENKAAETSERDGGIIVIAGSLYLAGRILTFFDENE